MILIITEHSLWDQDLGVLQAGEEENKHYKKAITLTRTLFVIYHTNLYHCNKSFYLSTTTSLELSEYTHQKKKLFRWSNLIVI